MITFGNSIKATILFGAYTLIHASVAYSANTSISQFDEIVDKAQDSELMISINDIDRSEWRVGDSIKLHVLSQNDCGLQMIHLDSNGVASVFDLGMINADQEAVYPKGSDFMTIQPPLGLDNIYVVCSDSPLPQMTQLSVPSVDGVIEAQNVGAFAQQYVGALDSNAKISNLSFKVKGRNDALALVSEDIVDFYSTRSRTIQRPKLDLNINFEFRSAELTDNAKILLDEVGQALNDQKMLGAKFELNGHTDDIGSDNYNMSLSAQRAEAVADYLENRHTVKDERLIPKGYGESFPKVENLNDESRAENRRVELILSRDL